MSAATLTGRRFTLRELHAIVRDEIKDRSYLATRLGPAVQDFLAWKRLSGAAERTLDQCERDLARLALAVPDTPFEDVSVNDLMLLLDLIPEGSWHRFRSHWNGFFEWGQRFDHRPDNPCLRLPKLKRQNTAPVYPVFGLPEQQALLDGCKFSLLPLVDYARVAFLNDTGARKAEACGFRLEHVDLLGRLVYLKGKGNKERLVPIRAELVSVLDRLMMEPLPIIDRPLGAGDYLWFPWRTTWLPSTKERRLDDFFPERPMLPRGFHEWWVRRVDEAGVRYRKPHMTRHTFATDLLDADVNLYDVKDLLGHESTRTTEIYIHSSRKRLNRASDRLDTYRNQAD